ncbi:MAG: winged helix-turn-helix domain-containing protein [Nesterenkonia sp.]|nr:winged helix-turn-helix domain-containing protein [Nesterenkonia sp.]
MRTEPDPQTEPHSEAPTAPDPAVSSDGDDPPAMRIASPVLICGGPSPAKSELAGRLRGLDVKVLDSPGAEHLESLLSTEEPRLAVVDVRARRRVSELPRAVGTLRGAPAGCTCLFWFDGDAEPPEILDLRRADDDHTVGTVDVEDSLVRLHLLSEALPEDPGDRFVVGDLELDVAARTVRRSGRDIDLSDTEFRLLRLLMRHARTVLPKTEILHEVWQYEFAGQANIVELYISYLRKKIEAERPKMIHTVRGAGYVLRPADPDLRDTAATDQ